MTNQKYVTGRRFKAKIQGVDYGELILKKCTAGCDWWDLFDMNGNCIICMREGDSLALSALGITELILLPDTEPQKGDTVDYTDNEFVKEKVGIYTGFQNEKGEYLIYQHKYGLTNFWKHIRLAKPIPTERELAEKKAREFMSGRDQMPRLRLLTEYIIERDRVE